MFKINGSQEDTLALALTSGANRVYTTTIDCYPGHQLSGEVVADVTVEARHGTIGAWTDIETTPIDLSPYSGTAQTFQFRITAGTITTHLIRTFRLRVGPPIVGSDTIVYNDDFDEVFNDDNDLVYTVV